MNKIGKEKLEDFLKKTPEITMEDAQDIMETVTYGDEEE